LVPRGAEALTIVLAILVVVSTRPPVRRFIVKTELGHALSSLIVVAMGCVVVACGSSGADIGDASDPGPAAPSARSTPVITPDAPISMGPQCPSGQFCLVNPSPTGASFVGVSPASSTSVFVLSENGVVYLNDGKTWTRVYASLVPMKAYGFFDSGRGDLFALGEDRGGALVAFRHHDGRWSPVVVSGSPAARANAFWVDPATGRGWAVGEEGTLSTLTLADPSFEPSILFIQPANMTMPLDKKISLTSIHGTSSSNVWVTGSWGQLYRLTNGELVATDFGSAETQVNRASSGWTQLAVLRDSTWALHSERDKEMLLAFDGKDWKVQAEVAVSSEAQQWSALTSNRATERPSSVASFDESGNVTDLWFGDRAFVVHYNALSNALTLPFTGSPHDAHVDQPAVEILALARTAAGPDGPRVWGVGLHGLLWTFDGDKVGAPSGYRRQLSSVSPVSSDDVWAIGGTFDGSLSVDKAPRVDVVHWDGQKLTASDPFAGQPVTTASISAIGKNDVWALAAGNPTFGLWVTPQNYLSIGHFDGTRWAMSRLDKTSWNAHGEISGDVWFAPTIHAIDATNVWVAGSETIARWDGKTWTRFELVGETIRGPYSISGSGPNDVWIVGTTVLHYDGKTLAPSLAGIAPVIHAFTSVWSASPNDAWLVGRDLVASEWVDVGYRWNGTTWSRAAIPLSAVSVTGRGANDVWFAGARYRKGERDSESWYGEATISHWDGSAFAEYLGAASEPGLATVGATRDGQAFWAAGEGGTLLGWRP
jgi:hypothetical protein